jgi:putative tryptophan/tyrosine transport system substrate-binding protein
MKRRSFVGLAGTAAVWPTGAWAQQPLPTIGLLSWANVAWGVAAIQTGLGEEGFVDGRNLTIVSRGADSQSDRLPALAADLVTQKVSVILATGGPLPARAAKAATTTIPIVFAYGGDPVADGLVASLNRPAANVTGVTFIGASLSSKKLELLREIVPRASEVGLLVNPKNTLAEGQIADTQAAAKALGLNLQVVSASNASEVDEAFKKLAQLKVDMLVLSVDPTFGILLAGQLVELAARYKIPNMFYGRAEVELGGLISYGAVIADTWRQAGIYVGRILKGAKPTDLPVLQPTKFELVVNLKTAKALGLTISESFLLRADEVIE